MSGKMRYDKPARTMMNYEEDARESRKAGQYFTCPLCYLRFRSDVKYRNHYKQTHAKPEVK